MVKQGYSKNTQRFLENKEYSYLLFSCMVIGMLSHGTKRKKNSEYLSDSSKISHESFDIYK